MSVYYSVALTILALAFLRRTIVSGFWSLAASTLVFLVLVLNDAYFLLNSLTGSGIDQSVLYHIGTGLEGAAFSDFTGLILASSVLAVAALVVGIGSYRFIRARTGHARTRVRKLVGATALAAAFLVNPTLVDVFRLAWQHETELARETGGAGLPAGFVSVRHLELSPPKENLVILYLESFERTYLDQQLFPGLAPNMAELDRKALTFTGMTQVVGSSWTIAGMVASQCGIPLAGSGFGSDQFLPGATCLGDLLKGAGYKMTFMGGASLEFAGKGTFYRTHGFDTVEGRDELAASQTDPGYLSSWGIYDDSLLNLAAHRFDALSARSDRFGLVVTTVDTHNPTGDVISKTCENVRYGDGRNKYLNAIHCADMMAGTFIRHVLESPAMKDTVLVVLSDHMARPNDATALLEKGERENLFLYFGPDSRPGVIARPSTTLDVAPTILGLMGAQTEALAFGRDLRGPDPSLRAGAKPLEEVIADASTYLWSLWSFPSLKDGIELDLATKRALLGERYVKLPALFEVDADLNVRDLIYPWDNETPLAVSLTEEPYDIRFIWVDDCRQIATLARQPAPNGHEYCAWAGSLGSPAQTLMPLTDGTAVAFDDLAKALEAVVPNQDYYQRTIDGLRTDAVFAGVDVIRHSSPVGLAGDFAVESSSGADARPSWLLNRNEGDKVFMYRGLTLLGLDAGQAPVKIAYKDTCQWGGEEFDPEAGLNSSFGDAIAENAPKYDAFVIVSHSSAVCYDIAPHLDQVFAGTDFSKWKDLSYEEPYVAVLSGEGHIEEYLGLRNSTLGIALGNLVGAGKPD